MVASTAVYAVARACAVYCQGMADSVLVVCVVACDTWRGLHRRGMTGVGRIGACVLMMWADGTCCGDTGTVSAMIIGCEWPHEGQSAPALPVLPLCIGSAYRKLHLAAVLQYRDIDPTDYVRVHVIPGGGCIVGG